MNIVMIAENDPAGMGIAFCEAINAHTDHHCRMITTTTKYNFNFQKDLHVPDLTGDGLDEMCDTLKHADVVHFHVLADEHTALGPTKAAEFVRGKTVVHHHHGHPDFRSNPDKYRQKYRRLRRKALVSTPDLLRLLPEATWQPNLVPIHAPLFLPQAVPVNGRIRIGQSVTRKEIKDTALLIQVIARIRATRRSPQVSVDIIENTEYRLCLQRKNRCHIVFDHMQGYFGVSSLESLSQGKPVIAGLDHWNLQHIMEFSGTSWIPWLVCGNEEELETCIRAQLNEPGNLKTIGQRGRAFMCHHWSDRKVVDKLCAFYTSC